MKNLNNLTFDYFKKYPKKARVINSIFIQIKKILKHENLEQEIEEISIFPYLFKIDEIKGILEIRQLNLKLLKFIQVTTYLH